MTRRDHIILLSALVTVSITLKVLDVVMPPAAGAYVLLEPDTLEVPKKHVASCDIVFDDGCNSCFCCAVAHPDSSSYIAGEKAGGDTLYTTRGCLCSAITCDSYDKPPWFQKEKKSEKGR